MCVCGSALAPELLAQEQHALSLLHERFSTVVKSALEISELQRQMTMPPSADVVATLQMLHGRTRQLITQSALDAYTLSSATVLSPAVEANLGALVHELYIQAKQMDLYEAELRLACEGRCSLLASLVVAKQAFPQTVMKQRPVADSVSVKLLQATQVAVRANSQVKCSLIMEEYGDATSFLFIPLLTLCRPTKTNKQAIVIEVAFVFLLLTI